MLEKKSVNSERATEKSCLTYCQKLAIVLIFKHPAWKLLVQDKYKQQFPEGGDYFRKTLQKN